LPQRRDMQYRPHGFFHVLHGYPFFLAVERVAAGKDVGAREAHKRKPGTVRSATYTAADGRHAGTMDGFHADFHDLWVLIEHLLHVAVLLLHLDPVATTGMPGYGRVHDICQFPFVGL